MPAIATAQICPFEDDTLEEACNRMAELEKKLPNERRKMFGLEPLNIEGMDVPYLPLNMMPVGADPVAPNVADN